jgi:hypothetical protein
MQNVCSAIPLSVALQLSWSEFGAGLDRLIESTYKERDVLLQRTTLPEWVTISRKVTCEQRTIIVCRWRCTLALGTEAATFAVAIV